MGLEYWKVESSQSVTRRVSLAMRMREEHAHTHIIPTHSFKQKCEKQEFFGLGPYYYLSQRSATLVVFKQGFCAGVLSGDEVVAYSSGLQVEGRCKAGGQRSRTEGRRPEGRDEQAVQATPVVLLICDQ